MHNSSQYHLTELQIALDDSDPRHILPPSLPASARVLDIGCGAGQSLIALGGDRLSFGLDSDLEALQLGRTITNRVAFVCGRAEALPFKTRTFDMVISRVTLPYTSLPDSLRETGRVLKNGATLWATLHSVGVSWKTARRLSPRAWLFFLYVVFNGLLFHFCGRQVSFFGKRWESFQTAGGMRRALGSLGFRQVEVRRENFFVVTAVR